MLVFSFNDIRILLILIIRGKLMNKIELNIPCGSIVGIDKNDYNEFRGIKYANAKRWEYPEVITNFVGTYHATEFGECSFQRRAFEDDEVCNAFYHKEFRKGMSFKYSEDCQFLNIYAPKDAKDCPVLIYIHGGSFTGGSNNEGHISGAEYAKNGIIFVAINYRLNAFGFCSHPDLEKDGRCGNFGLYDQVAAIQWVKDNICGFGGNPDNIVLLGQSAGAMSVDILISSPLCKGWFKGAIMMSGAGLQRIAGKPFTPEKTRKFWDNACKHAGVNNVNQLKALDEKSLFYAWSDACKDEKISLFVTSPVYDGKLLTKETFNTSTIPNIPIILGETITDMVPIALELLTKKYARLVKKNDNCYVYNFNRNLPGDNAGAWHSADLLYAFKTMENNWRPFEEIDYKISDEIFSAFCAFVKTGNPNCDAIPHWSTDYKKPLRFCENTRVAPWETKQLFKNTFANNGAEF